MEVNPYFKGELGQGSHCNSELWRDAPAMFHQGLAHLGLISSHPKASTLSVPLTALES